ncbi:uncharacterized protein METZ01_LOCUS336954 [marine metagenome]|uniref:Uncharacterized protein n=1 Tax=marine metagenome TaxID=408172 RepID=A0A382QGN4_9ZZZZ
MSTVALRELDYPSNPRPNQGYSPHQPIAFADDLLCRSTLNSFD